MRPEAYPEGIPGPFFLAEISKGARPPVDVRHLTFPGNEPGLVGWWLLDEGTDQWVYDSSLGGHDGTLGETPGVDAYDPVWAYQTD